MKRRQRLYTNYLLIGICCLCFLQMPLVHAASWTLSAEEWARPRSAAALAQMPALKSALKAFNQTGTASLVIRYPGGEEGALWASELRDWLVSMGVPSGRVEIRPGQSTYENITLMLGEPEGE